MLHKFHLECKAFRENVGRFLSQFCICRCAFHMNCFANLNSITHTHTVSQPTKFKFYNYFLNFWFFFLRSINYNWVYAVCTLRASTTPVLTGKNKPYSNHLWWARTSNKRRDLARDKRWTDWMTAIHSKNNSFNLNPFFSVMKMHKSRPYWDNERILKWPLYISNDSEIWYWSKSLRSSEMFYQIAQKSKKLRLHQNVFRWIQFILISNVFWNNFGIIRMVVHNFVMGTHPLIASNFKNQNYSCEHFQSFALLWTALSIFIHLTGESFSLFCSNHFEWCQTIKNSSLQFLGEMKTIHSNSDVKELSHFVC